MFSIPIKEESIPLSFAHADQNFQLLELPNSLLETLEDSYQRTTRLYLKSSVRRTHDASTTSVTGALLCTENKTFEVRQVQSSNSIHILQYGDVLDSAQTDPTGYKGVKSDANAGLCVIAQCKGVLEAVESASAQAEAMSYLRSRLPIHDALQLYPEANEASHRQSAMTALGLLEDAPCSEGELNAALRDLRAFQVPGTGLAIPTPAMLLRAWSAFYGVATIQGIDLTKPLRFGNIATSLEEDGISEDLLLAILQGIATEISGTKANQVFELDSVSGANWLRQLAASTGTQDNELEQNLPAAWNPLTK
ncbi:hypothetical protein MMC25_005612 [Agyrium rufum]|nr:hypothetical protein [Agyrium rufum]